MALLRPVTARLAATLLLLLAVPTPPVAVAQVVVQDTTAEEETALRVRPLPERHSPRGALWRAAAAPGWGQVYNRQYYKLPIVYGGLAGVLGTALYTNAQYLRYRHAYLYAAPEFWKDGAADYPQYRDAYLRALAANDIPASRADEADLRTRMAERFLTNRDILRRNRDLLYIGVGLFYGLTIVDAYVNAHLLDFDVGEDLSVSVYPVPGGVTAVVRPAR